MENLVNVLITVLENIFSIKDYVLKIGNLIIFNVLYTVINTISNILNYIFGLPIFDKKEIKEIKKSPFKGDFRLVF